MVPVNAANLLTVFRIILVPVVIALLAGQGAGPLPLATLVFAVAALTDAADGHLARSRDMITTFGRLMDPLADKLLVGGALVSLVVIDRLALWIAVVVILREVAVSALRWYAGTRGIVVAVSPLGKAKTVMQMSAIVLLMLVPDAGAAWVEGLMLAVAAVTVASGLEYALSYARRTAAAPAGAVRVSAW